MKFSIHATIFENARKALQSFSAKGFLTGEGGKSLEAVQTTVTEIIVNILSQRESDDSIDWLSYIRPALHDLHKNADYTIRAKVIRDLADISATFECVLLGQGRKRHYHLSTAAMFCLHVRDELKQKQ